MKKYFIISIIANIILALLSSYGLLQYLVYSSNASLSSTIDLLVLIGVVILDILINYGIYKILKSDVRKIFILIPSSVYLLLIGILIMYIG